MDSKFILYSCSTMSNWIQTKFLASVLIAIALPSSAALACEALLKSSPHQFLLRKPTLSKRAKEALADLMVSFDRFATEAQQSLLFPLPWGKTGYQFILFVNSEVRPTALHVKGEQGPEGFRVESLKLAPIDEQKKYFEHVALINGITDETVELNQPLLGCRELVMRGWVAAKLWLKHHMHASDVVKSIDDSIALEIPRSHSNQPEYVHGFEIKNRTQHTWLRLVVEKNRRCPLQLKTIFVNHEH